VARMKILAAADIVLFGSSMDDHAVPNSARLKWYGSAHVQQYETEAMGTKIYCVTTLGPALNGEYEYADRPSLARGRAHWSSLSRRRSRGFRTPSWHAINPSSVRWPTALAEPGGAEQAQESSDGLAGLDTLRDPAN